MAFRDASVVVIETARTVVRAALGLHELLRTPSVIIQARVGLRKSANTNDFRTETGASTSRASSLPLVAPPNATVGDYLVGTQLDDALAAGQDIAISWPFADGDVRDWTQAEAIWKYVLFNQLERRRAQNESPVLLSMYPGLSRDTYERTCQVFFERFNVAGFSILERPMAQLYATTSLSGVVVDIEYDKTDITPIYEGFIQRSACDTIPLGIRDCQEYLVHILRHSNPSLMKTLFPPDSEITPSEEIIEETLLAFVKQILQEGHIRVPSDGETALPDDEGVTDIAAIVVAGKEKAVIESGMKKKANAKASAAEQARAREIEALDLITVQFRDKSVTLGKERHRLCEPLFDPTLLNGLGKRRSSVSLQNATGHAVRQTELDMRQYIWQGLFVTGDLTRHVKGIAIALQSRLSPFIAQPELQTDVQPRSIRILSLPEYYPEYRDTGEGFAAFLGCSIVAKLTFGDPHGKNFVSKADYSQKGPHSIIEMSPALL
ncbi:actin-related protein [Lentinula edodes]|uniref:actin-related protein n=1 Tax=Lentinula edodes TaxID=5353 RepID=UPI001E8EDB8C|nr:actin-related protein [Lentinula edodes]KAH7872993.1 actin-related protein [Lentinula edodes]